MASSAPNTGGCKIASPDFQINGTNPFFSEEPGEYIRVAHAVACLGAGNTGDEGKELYCNDQIIAGSFDAIAMLLAHAERLIEAGAC